MLRIFVDRPSALGKLERTPAGGARIPAVLARVGIMEYVQDGRVIRQYNPPEVLAAAAASAADCPVTLNHPKERLVDSANYERESRGHVTGAPAPTFDPETGLLSGVLVVQSPALIDAIETGTARQVSMGYQAEIDETPGTTPEGEAYDWIRTKLLWNHAAVVPAGRAGVARLLLDAEGASLLDEEEKPMIIDGSEITQDAAQALIDALRSELETARAASSAEALAVLVDAAVAERERAAAEAAEAARLAGLAAARRSRAAAAYPKLSLDGKSDDYVSALIDRLDADAEGIEALRGGTVEVDCAPKASKAPKASQREAFLAAQRELWKSPVSDS